MQWPAARVAADPLPAKPAHMQGAAACLFPELSVPPDGPLVCGARHAVVTDPARLAMHSAWCRMPAGPPGSRGLPVFKPSRMQSHRHRIGKEHGRLCPHVQHTDTTFTPTGLICLSTCRRGSLPWGCCEAAPRCFLQPAWHLHNHCFQPLCKGYMPESCLALVAQSITQLHQCCCCLPDDTAEPDPCHGFNADLWMKLSTQKYTQSQGVSTIPFSATPWAACGSELLCPQTCHAKSRHADQTGIQGLIAWEHVHSQPGIKLQILHNQL